VSEKIRAPTRMKTTNAESLAVDSMADFKRVQLNRLGLRSSQRLKIASNITPLAPIAPPSVGVATPMKIVPSTRKIRNSGGTITNVTCSAMWDRQRKPSHLLQTQLKNAITN